jgi:hypothetical protein
MKISLTGRPGRIVEQGNVIITTMQQSKAPTLPKGLPAPPDKPTVYVIYIGQKQWNKVKENIKNPEETLIIEGYPFFDKEINAFSVLSTRTTTKSSEMGKRQKKGETGDGSASDNSESDNNDDNLSEEIDE